MGKKTKPNISSHTLQWSVRHDSDLSSGINEWNFLEIPSKGAAQATIYRAPPSWNIEVMVGIQAAVLRHEAGITEKNGETHLMKGPGSQTL